MTPEIEFFDAKRREFLRLWTTLVISGALTSDEARSEIKATANAMAGLLDLHENPEGVHAR